METLVRNVVTLSITFAADYNKAFDYLADPLNQKEWAVHFVLDVERTSNGYMATLPFAKLPFRIDSNQSSGVLDIYLGGGKPTRTRLIEIDKGLCTYNFTLAQPKEMDDDVWEKEGLPNMKEELEILKSELEKL